MAKKSVLYYLFSDMLGALKTVVETKYVFLQDRPLTKDGDAPMSRFAVISFPLSIEDFVVGNKKKLLNTVGIFYLFVQARNNGTLDVNAAGDFADEVVGLFPIKGKYCSAANPKVVLTGKDGQGFQVARITFDLQTKWEAFK